MYARNGERELARRVRIEQRMQMQLEHPDDLADLEGFGHRGELGAAGRHERDRMEARQRAWLRAVEDMQPGMEGFHRDREMFEVRALERRARDAGRQQVLLEQAQQQDARRAGLEQRLASAAARRNAEVAQVREAEERARARDERRRVINQGILAPEMQGRFPEDHEGEEMRVHMRNGGPGLASPMGQGSPMRRGGELSQAQREDLRLQREEIHRSAGEDLRHLELERRRAAARRGAAEPEAQRRRLDRLDRAPAAAVRLTLTLPLPLTLTLTRTLPLPLPYPYP